MQKEQKSVWKNIVPNFTHFSFFHNFFAAQDFTAAFMLCFHRDATNYRLNKFVITLGLPKTHFLMFQLRGWQMETTRTFFLPRRKKEQQLREWWPKEWLSLCALRLGFWPQSEFRCRKWPQKCLVWAQVSTHGEPDPPTSIWDIYIPFVPFPIWYSNFDVQRQCSKLKWKMLLLIKGAFLE